MDKRKLNKNKDREITMNYVKESITNRERESEIKKKER